MPLAPSPEPPVTPVVQVRRYSWHSYAKHVSYDKRREFVGTNRRTKANSLLFSQQEPLVSRVHLMKVIRKIGQQERSRGRHLTVNMFKKPFSNGGKVVTSSSHPNRKVKGENISCSGIDNSGIGIFSYKYPHINDKCNSRCSEMQEKEREEESVLPGTPDGEGMVTSSISDVTIREAVWELDVNKLVARKHLESRNRLRSYSEKGFEKAFKVYNKVVTFIALYLAIVTNILGGLTDIIWYERKNTVGNSDSLPRSESLRNSSCYSFSIFRECLDNILGFNRELWLYAIIYTIWRKNKLFRYGKEELWKLVNTLTFRLVIAMSWLRNLLLGNVYRETFSIRSGNVAKTFLAGKCFRAYLCLFADFWASCRCYLYIYGNP